MGKQGNKGKVIYQFVVLAVVFHCSYTLQV